MGNRENYAVFEVTPEIEAYAKLCEENNAIDKELYTRYEVKRGLRDLNGKGVLAGLTNISDVCAKKIIDGEEVPCEGNLYYRGYNIKDLVKGFLEADHFGFEETAYLLLFGELPGSSQLKAFEEVLAERRTLPPTFVRDVIMKAPSRDMMNSLSRSILNLYSYDSKADDTSIPNVLRQCLNLISQFPMLMLYGYHAYNYRRGEDLFIYAPSKELSTAENILMMLRENRTYSKLEARILDMALVLHMDHGGGNNSTFTTHVVTSSGTDTYSTMAAAMASLKGPKHGGANIKVTQMFEDMKNSLKDWTDKEAVENYLENLLDKKAFDQKGLIYGMGHAVYSVSDPRAEIFKQFVKQLATEKGYEKEYALYEMVEHMAPEVIARKRKIYKGVNANVDFYSGLVYGMLDLPASLYTPIFATARIVGWSAHRLEELKNVDKIIRPAYKPLTPYKAYIPMGDRG
ncbi:citrate/2-methylcitrate synthase [Suipraeoptans intestinalis]|uniref:citrate/2-methylcitrate synthase n=1 Tax=Suipraeoptans intestinalis TaxID=2606628 RepID=UPI0023F0889A|nr:citrate/2-methylcitrate synthase [Suipraeoptans intestinalis]MDD7769791.1 citrate/2-methylcitrate synthase [Suipraeoptans intestinalis]MDY3121044.1 citrate/2-methylcitrate synthase [Suipraeoptans intestinalis]